MKKLFRQFALAVLLLVSVGASAQQVTTLYFLENAPMRHIVNPAFQPVSNGYINFTPLGYTSLWAGNNSLTMSDLIYIDPLTGQTITALHPNGDKAALLRAFRKSTLVDADMTLDLLSFGFRTKNENGYFHFSIMERVDAGVALPYDLFGFVLGGGMKDLNGGFNYIDLSQLGVDASVYTEVGFGYSHRINDQWTVGGKAKFLLGTAYAGLTTSNLGIDASASEWRLHGMGTLAVAAPINWEALPDEINKETAPNIDPKELIDLNDTKALIKSILKPSGYGAAFDLGFTYKPIEQLQITAAINDLGFIYWNEGRRYNCEIDTTFTGVGEFTYDHYVVNGKFDSDSLLRDVKSNLIGIVDGTTATMAGTGFARMLSGKLNVGIDANFWDNRIGLGVVSKTRLYNRRLYEEVTVGAALRPCNWFNLAVSYSLVNNGKYSNIGAGLSFMPYDGINLTLAMDYIPTSYAYYDIDNGNGKTISCPIPYKSKGVNLAMGFSIVWGTNKGKKDSDKDGIYDKIDMCPNTPKNVIVDALGCPIDSDGDGVPDYLDHCPGTPEAAYGLVDSVGCPIDSDGDGVPDYLDECPNTPAEAQGMVDAKGCELDTDGDGVPDWRDECPGTPAQANGMVDDKGCLLDTDGDGVPDYLDECPDTPAEARGMVDEKGCPIDSDGDGVPDYLDECPNTPAEAKGFVDEKGCEIDTDGDGVPDWKDECPTVTGPAYNKGCPEVKREVRNLLKKAMQGIQFENGKSTIKRASYPLLDKIAQTFIDNPTFIIEVQGHTDNVGGAEMNKNLSDRRAHAVMDYLVHKGVPAERMTAHGYGMEVPIADNKTAKGRALNRRVEFNITFEEITYETILDHADSTLLPKQDTIPAVSNDSL